MDLYITESLQMGGRVGRENYLGLMEVGMKEGFKTINFMVVEFIIGQMEGCMKVNGNRARCMGMVHFIGRMAKNLLGNL